MMNLIAIMVYICTIKIYTGSYILLKFCDSGLIALLLIAIITQAIMYVINI